MSIRKISVVFALLLAFAANNAQASDLWFHVTVNESSEDANISLNLPLSLVEKALAMIPAEVTDSSQLVFGDQQLTAQDLRDLWRAVQDTQDVNFVTVDNPDESLRVSKSGGYLTVRGTPNSENGSDIDVRLPFAVVDALLDTDHDGQLNFAGALRALADHGEGELATITDNDARVRVWIDSYPEAR